MAPIHPRDLRQAVSSDRATSLPVALPEAVDAAVRAAHQEGGLVKSLPGSAAMMRKEKKVNVPSALSQSLAAWFETDAGKKWQDDRKKLFDL